MPASIVTGPLLGLESDSLYTVCFTTAKSVGQASVTASGQAINAVHISDTASYRFWRTEITLPPQPSARQIRYSVHLDGSPANDRNNRSEWAFYVPAQNEKPKFAYASCNGFSSADLVNKTEHPYALWEKLQQEHQAAPFSLLLMGGDQLYADEIWSQVPALKEWNRFTRQEKARQRQNKTLLQQVDRFYDELYPQRWSNPIMSELLASIPTVMMWDDHDIFDGWGSYPEDLQNCEVFKAIFTSAKQYFELLQIRSNRNTSLLNRDCIHYAFGFQFRGIHILALDNRSERTLAQVMSRQQWDDLIGYLDNQAQQGDLLLLTAVPVVYRDFSFADSALDATPWDEELTDDLKDHWRAKEHQGERARLIMRLLDNAAQRQKDGRTGRTVILSGDVHVGCLGVINDWRDPQKTRRVHQVVSSGIVHPAPSRIAWYGIMAVTNDDVEHLNEDKSIEISMLKPYSADRYLRSRNFVTLQEGGDKKLWLNWFCESRDKPVYPIE